MNSLNELMTTHDCVNSCIPPLRKIISMASGIPLNNIRNGLSIRGADLVRQNGDTLTPFQPEDSFAVFYLKPTSEVNITTSEPNGSISNIISIELNLNIYGNDCIDRTQKLKTLIKSDTYRDMLDDYGFTINKMDNGTIFTEPINGIFYLRCDTSITFNTVIAYACDCEC